MNVPDRFERRSGEESDGARGPGWRDSLAADARFALRHFRRRWGTTVTMLAILSLGMSISTLLFSVVYSFAVQPPPVVAREDGLVRIRGSQAGESGVRRSRAFSLEEFEEYRRLNEHFSAVAGWANAEVGLDVTGDSELGALTADATFVTENYFAVLGVRPVMGAGLPTYEAEDPASARVAVIGHLAWDRLFGRSPGAIGRTLLVNGVPVTVVGVAPPRFIGVGAGGQLQVWLPLSSRHAVLPPASAESLGFRAAARLRPGVTPGAAEAAVQV
ncbi:MAG TPA: ABC transporter permease, partial [Longimicrobiaceae bacterium]|nr:ABC transporter permease [Longimicrobiaceae bacterium]